MSTKPGWTKLVPPGGRPHERSSLDVAEMMSDPTPEERLANATAGMVTMLREFADVYENGVMPPVDAQTALRTVALMLEGVAEAELDQGGKPQPDGADR
jgi:hypothetical protein